MEIVGRLNRLASEIAMAALRVRYPEATERENQLRLASRTVDRATMIRAFGWDPTCEGTDARRGARRDYRGASSRTTSSAPTANGP
jgi:hypothetical protein